MRNERSYSRKWVGALFLRSDDGKGASPVAGRLNSSSYGPGPEGQARNVVEQVPSCRLRRHRSLLLPSHIPFSADSFRNQRPAIDRVNNTA